MSIIRSGHIDNMFLSSSVGTNATGTKVTCRTLAVSPRCDVKVTSKGQLIDVRRVLVTVEWSRDGQVHETGISGTRPRHIPVTVLNTLVIAASTSTECKLAPVSTLGASFCRSDMRKSRAWAERSHGLHEHPDTRLQYFVSLITNEQHTDSKLLTSKTAYLALFTYS